MLSTPSPPSADRVPAQRTGDEDLGVLVRSAAASPIRPEHASELVDCQIASDKGHAGDCVCRAIAIATGKPYREVYDELYARQDVWLGRPTRGRRQGLIRERAARYGTSPRNGVWPEVMRQYLTDLGWAWKPTMKIGSGCKVHLREDELPPGRLIAKLSRHVAAVIDGVLHDTHDSSRGGTRCVYGSENDGVP
jgi:hypothetical protein